MVFQIRAVPGGTGECEVPEIHLREEILLASGPGNVPLSFQIKDGKIILRGQRKKAGVYAPRIPLTEGKKYRCRIKARGQGTGICRCLRRPYRLEMKLSGEEREYELKFIPQRGEPHFYAALKAEPGSELILPGFRLDYGK